MLLHGVEYDEPTADYRPLRIRTSRGEVACRHYPAAGATRAAVWVGGARGGWDSPAHGLYPRLCRALQPLGVASLHVRFRDPTRLPEAVLDAMAGVALLEGAGAGAVALVGHSFGGAVAIQAAAHRPVVRTVVTLATQGYGTDPVARLGPRCSVLLIHGSGDRVLSPECSEAAYHRAREPKRFILHSGAGHGLDEFADEVESEVADWLAEQLSPQAPS
jgi:pimeloyl-ACP methyl ester carboxylesterase